MHVRENTNTITTFLSQTLVITRQVASTNPIMSIAVMADFPRTKMFTTSLICQCQTLFELGERSYPSAMSLHASITVCQYLLWKGK